MTFHGEKNFRFFVLIVPALLVLLFYLKKYYDWEKMIKGGEAVAFIVFFLFISNKKQRFHVMNIFFFFYLKCFYPLTSLLFIILCCPVEIKNSLSAFNANCSQTATGKFKLFWDLFQLEWSIILYRSIALDVLYNFCFGLETIGVSFRPQIHAEHAGGNLWLCCCQLLTGFWGLTFDRIVMASTPIR